MNGKKIRVLPLFLMLFLLTACGDNGGAGKKEDINIGYQKNGTTLTLKAKKVLEKELGEDGYSIKWSEFSTASSILEALNAGSIDIANGGDAPSIMALSKGMDFVYIAGEASATNAEGILVSKESGIKSLEELKGKKIAFNKASISQYLLTQALKSVGLTIDDVEPVFLNPPDASIAFEKGDVDAWVVWDPYMTVAESKGNIVLRDAEGIVPFRSFYFSTSKFADEHPEIVESYVKNVSKVGGSIDENPAEAADLLQKETNIAKDIWSKVLGRKKSDVSFIEDEAINDLQAEADDLLDIGLINKAVTIKDHVWEPKSK